MERTVEYMVSNFKVIRMMSKPLYFEMVNQFKAILKGEDKDNIWQTYYPDKELSFFEAVLQGLHEL